MGNLHGRTDLVLQRHFQRESYGLFNRYSNCLWQHVEKLEEWDGRIPADLRAGDPLLYLQPSKPAPLEG